MSAELNWDGAAFKKELTRELQLASVDAGVLVQLETKRRLNLRASNVSSGGTPSPPGTPPARRSGDLGRSIQIDASQQTKKNPMVRVGSNLPYARIHEFGGTIHARAKLLAIPVRREAQLRKPKDVPGLSFIPVVSTNAAGRLCKRIGKGKNAKLETWYILARRSHIPARPYMRPALAASRNPVFDRAAERVRSLVRKYGAA